MSRLTNLVGTAAGLLLLSPLVAPRVLAFPYTANVEQHRIYSELPIDRSVKALVFRADATMLGSPLGRARALNQDIFLTNGGWRWSWLALSSRRAFALSKPVTENIIVNRSNPARNVVENGLDVGGQRTLDGTLVHEMTHGAIRAHLGTFADWNYPADIREGYCDYVAGSGSLSDRQARTLEGRGSDAPALHYWRARKAVEAALARNGGSVDALFAER